MPPDRQTRVLCLCLFSSYSVNGIILKTTQLQNKNNFDVTSAPLKKKKESLDDYSLLATDNVGFWEPAGLRN